MIEYFCDEIQMHIQIKKHRVLDSRCSNICLAIGYFVVVRARTAGGVFPFADLVEWRLHWLVQF